MKHVIKNQYGNFIEGKFFEELTLYDIINEKEITLEDGTLVEVKRVSLVDDVAHVTVEVVDL